MTRISADDRLAVSQPAKAIQPAWVRIFHWINAAAMIVMILSGWQIYNASPLFDFTFSPFVTLGGWLAGGLLWHFAAMWLLMVDGLIYLVLVSPPDAFVASCCRSASAWPPIQGCAVRQAASRRSSRYPGAEALVPARHPRGIVVVLFGLAISKPVQFQSLTAMFGGYDVARYVHFICMALIVAFLVVHVALANSSAAACWDRR